MRIRCPSWKVVASGNVMKLWRILLLSELIERNSSEQMRPAMIGGGSSRQGRGPTDGNFTA
eukprot:15296506-Heterocapsa_arctica.AAC.1